ncbi:hypothetical protein SK128_021670, partial [Halocaridina rubra]
MTTFTRPLASVHQRNSLRRAKNISAESCGERQISNANVAHTLQDCRLFETSEVKAHASIRIPVKVIQRNSAFGHYNANDTLYS